jgi:hypothetical protein
MNLPALKGGVSCKRYIVYEVRSGRKLFNRGIYYRFFVGVTKSNRPEARTRKRAKGIRPRCEYALPAASTPEAKNKAARMREAEKAPPWIFVYAGAGKGQQRSRVLEERYKNHTALPPPP